MHQDTKQPWVLMGYHLFAQHGPKGLKVEVLAQRVGKSKSSFYHHFADLEVFIEVLFMHHTERARQVAAQGARCQNVVPELVNMLLDAKEDLLFNRQLRIHHNVPAFRQCLEQACGTVGGAIDGIWADMLGLVDRSSLAQMVLALSLENFYLQI